MVTMESPDEEELNLSFKEFLSRIPEDKITRVEG
jgi:hypothetical protein